MVLMFCTSSDDALYLCEVLAKYLKGFQLTELTRVHSRNGHFQYLLCSKGGGDSKRRLTITTVFVFWLSSHDALRFWEISWNISNGCQLSEQTKIHGRNGYIQCSKGNNSKSRQTRLMVHEFCTSSHEALNLCEVSSKYLKPFPTYRADTNTW